MNKYEINSNWEPYYNALEAIRRIGICNMFDAAPYLAKYMELDEKFATKVLVNWMSNYNVLSARYGWR